MFMRVRPLKIFFSGIAGSGVSAIAVFMADRGNSVSGSDRTFDINPRHPLKEKFQKKGICIVPQDGSGIDSTVDCAVFSTAVEPDRPEVVKARLLGTQMKTRPEFLAEISQSFSTIAVAGTSGKSTTSGMLAFLMKRLGREPNLIGGGRVKQFVTSSNPGNTITGNSDYLVIEACESDGTIIHYRPQHTILLNLALDHHTVDETSRMFETLMENTSGKIILNSDDANLGEIAHEHAVTFSVYTPSRYRPDTVSLKPFSTDFTLRNTKFTLSLPGEYNLYNALSCIAFLSEIGISHAELAEVLHEFQGIERRFDVHLNDGNRLVIDDYAHNPHKISSLMKTVKTMKERICYIFQPHGFGSTRLMKKEYIETFAENLRDSDHLVLLPIYYAGGTAGRDISSADLAEGIRFSGRSVEAVAQREEILEKIHGYEACIIFGARDETLSDLAKQVARELSG
ncbi:MAG: hypothetical protein C4538_03270 [Nitrospiraceae bacterium]|nr:MAG: hypothetical protein C4538_03270 [Nitrospiraceae bacterium]